jgi:hypothetical protein
VTGPDARGWWLALEPVHAVVYFDDGCRASMADIGLRGFWMGYFAGRAAPLGPVDPDVVAAMFFNFHPDMVGRALPDAWGLADPDRVWAARRSGAAEALRRLAPEVERLAAVAVPLLEQAVSAASGSGRPLFAATRATGWPSDPVEALWHGCTCLREHRGDGHVAALAASGLDGAEALVLFAASEGLPAAMFRAARGWSGEEWLAAEDRLRARGLIDGVAISPAGGQLRRTIEAMTDRQAERPMAVLDERQRRELLDSVLPVTDSVHASGVVAYPNPMGLPAPSGA